MFLRHCQMVRDQQYNGQLLWSVSVRAVNLTLVIKRVMHYSNQSSITSRLILAFDEGLDSGAAAAVEDVEDDSSQPTRYCLYETSCLAGSRTGHRDSWHSWPDWLGHHIPGWMTFQNYKRWPLLYGTVLPLHTYIVICTSKMKRHFLQLLFCTHWFLHLPIISILPEKTCQLQSS